MSKWFKLSLLYSSITWVVAVIGYFIVPHSIIVQFNQPTYGAKVYIFLLPIIILVVNVVLFLLVQQDRKKSDICSPVLITPNEIICTCSNLLATSITLYLMFQQIYFRK